MGKYGKRVSLLYHKAVQRIFFISLHFLSCFNKTDILPGFIITNSCPVFKIQRTTFFQCQRGDYNFKYKLLIN